MFVDEAKIYIESGKGGNGCASFRREKYVANGGPDGGDGGKGGDVVFVTEEGLNTLSDFRNRRIYKADRGGDGSGKNCHGKDAADLVIAVPIGTVLREESTGLVVADLSKPNMREVILQGGRGGQGQELLQCVLFHGVDLHLFAPQGFDVFGWAMEGPLPAAFA